MRAGGHQGKQQIVELVLAARLGTHLLEHGRDGIGVESRHFVGGDRQAVRPELAEPTPQGQGAGTALLERCVVEVGERTPAQNGVREGGRLGRLHGVHLDGTRFDARPDVDQSFDPEPLVEAVVDRLARQDVIGNGHRPGRRVLLAGGQAGPHRSQEIVGLHALEVDGAPLAAVHAREHEGAVQVPAPARAQHRVEEHGLGEHLWHGFAREHVLDPGQREAVLGAEREHDRVVIGCGLQLEVEGDAEALAKSQPKGAVDASAKRRVQDQLRTLALVEAAFDDDALLGGQVAERAQPGGTVGHHLLGHLGGDAGALAHQHACALTVSGAQHRLERGPQVGDRL